MIKRINTTGLFQLNLSEIEIEILTTEEIVIVIPKWVPQTYTLKIKCLVASCNVTVRHDIANINGSADINLTDGILIVDYKSAAGFVATNLTASDPTPPVNTGWGANTQITQLHSNLGLSVSTFDTNGYNFDYISLIDASVTDVFADLETIEIYNGLIKVYKVKGPNKLFLESSVSGFSDGTNILEVSEYAVIVYDLPNAKWQILYNNTVTNTKIKSKKITGINCETWSTGVEIEPTKAGVIFMPKTAFLVAEDNHSELAKSSINQFSKGYSNNFVTSGVINLSLNQNISFIYSGVNNEEFKNDLYLFGIDYITAGNVTLYVTYQEIAL